VKPVNTTLAVLLLLGCAGTTAIAQKSSSASPSWSRNGKSKASAPAPIPAQAAPLNISYKDGLLSIAANDSLLRNVLAQLHQRTGVTFDGTVDANERVTVNLGPGPAVLIVAALLEQTGYNFVITAAARDPRLLQSIQLTPKPSLLEDIAPADLMVEEERAPTPQAQAKSKRKTTDDDGWTDVEEQAASPSDSAASPPK
jgi:hypothetical protein